jgi:hypothetical protein
MWPLAAWAASIACWPLFAVLVKRRLPVVIVTFANG